MMIAGDSIGRLVSVREALCGLSVTKGDRPALLLAIQTLTAVIEGTRRGLAGRAPVSDNGEILLARYRQSFDAWWSDVGAKTSLLTSLSDDSDIIRPLCGFVWDGAFAIVRTWFLQRLESDVAREALSQIVSAIDEAAGSFRRSPAVRELLGAIKAIAQRPGTRGAIRSVLLSQTFTAVDSETFVGGAFKDILTDAGELFAADVPAPVAHAFVANPAKYSSVLADLSELRAWALETLYDYAGRESPLYETPPGPASQGLTDLAQLASEIADSPKPSWPYVDPGLTGAIAAILDRQLSPNREALDVRSMAEAIAVFLQRIQAPAGGDCDQIVQAALTSAQAWLGCAQSPSTVDHIRGALLKVARARLYMEINSTLRQFRKCLRCGRTGSDGVFLCSRCQELVTALPEGENPSMSGDKLRTAQQSLKDIRIALQALQDQAALLREIDRLAAQVEEALQSAK
jgi:hypothetical protein